MRNRLIQRRSLPFRRFAWSFIVLGASFGAGQSVYSQDWTQTPGPTGGVVTAIVAHDGQFFAGTLGGGLYRTDVNGSSWTPANGELNGALPRSATITALVSVDQTIFAGTQMHGVYRSTNAGQQWTVVNNGLGVDPEGHFSVRQLVVQNNDETVTSIIAAMTNAKSQSELFRSTNFGESWQNISPTDPPGLGTVVANDRVLFVGVVCCSGLAHQSLDGGTTWTLSGMPRCTSFATIGKTIFVANANIGNSRQLFQSNDDGTTWSEIGEGIPLDTAVLALAADGGTVLAAVRFSSTSATPVIYRSVDLGATWQPMTDGFAPGAARLVNCIAAHQAAETSHVLVGTQDGVQRSMNAGDNWKASNDGLIATSIQSIERSPNGSAIYATVVHPMPSVGAVVNDVALNRVMKLSTGRDVWNTLSQGFPPGAEIGPLLSVAALRSNLENSLLFAGTSSEGVYRSNDGGLNWIAARAGLGFGSGGYRAIHRLAANGAMVFAATQPWSFSSDHGNSFHSGGGVYRTANHGDNWVLASAGLPVFTSGQNTFYPKLTGFGVVAGVALVATDRLGLFRSTNNGENWTAVNAGIPMGNADYFPQFVAFAMIDSQIYAASRGYFAGPDLEGNGVFRSSDGGSTWLQLPAFAGDRPVISLTASCGVLFAGVGCDHSSFCSNDPAHGIYRSDDGGVNWKRIHHALDGVSAPALMMDGLDLVAGTRGFGVWRVAIDADCNANGMPDRCDILAGASLDANRNFIPDECELGVPGDITGDGLVNVNDLLAVINNWGPCPTPPMPCPADISPAPNAGGGDGVVNVNDLLMVINNWG